MSSIKYQSKTLLNDLYNSEVFFSSTSKDVTAHTFFQCDGGIYANLTNIVGGYIYKQLDGESFANTISITSATPFTTSTTDERFGKTYYIYSWSANATEEELALFGLTNSDEPTPITKITTNSPLYQGDEIVINDNTITVLLTNGDYIYVNCECSTSDTIQYNQITLSNATVIDTDCNITATSDSLKDEYEFEYTFSLFNREKKYAVRPLIKKDTDYVFGDTFYVKGNDETALIGNKTIARINTTKAKLSIQLSGVDYDAQNDTCSVTCQDKTYDAYYYNGYIYSIIEYTNDVQTYSVTLTITRAYYSNITSTFSVYLSQQSTSDVTVPLKEDYFWFYYDNDFVYYGQGGNLIQSNTTNDIILYGIKECINPYSLTNAEKEELTNLKKSGGFS